MSGLREQGSETGRVQSSSVPGSQGLGQGGLLKSPFPSPRKMSWWGLLSPCCAPSSLLDVKPGTVAMLPLRALAGAHTWERTAHSCLSTLTCHLGTMTMGTSMKEPRCLLAWG